MNTGPDAAHILVIDDDQRIRDLLKRFLARNGYLVTVARDAAHADPFAASPGFRFDGHRCDDARRDGLSFTRRIREELETPVLLLTARGETDDRIEGLEAGADDYLAKPFDARELLLRVAAILRRAAPPVPEIEPPKTLTLGDKRYDLIRGELTVGDSAVRLTSTEQA